MPKKATHLRHLNTARMQRYRKRRKQGLEVFRILAPREDIYFTLEQMGVLPTRDRALAELALNQIVQDWLLGWRRH